MNEQVENNDKYAVLERVMVSTGNGDCIAVKALGRICFALDATNDDAAGEEWVATTISNSIVFERRLWL